MNKKNIAFIILLICCLSCTTTTKTFTKDEISIVPKPSKTVLGEGSFLFSNTTTIFIAEKNQKIAAKFLIDLFKKAAGYELVTVKNKDKANVIFSKDSSLKPEAYTLKVTPKQIIINANDAAGYFYGVQTIRQLLPASIETTNNSEEKWLVPSITINDKPRFSWRGMHMDFSRHYFGIDEVKDFLDYMALYKLNTYHMHLTDDQGWRIEIKKYPLLTEKGAWRLESSHDKVCKKLAKDNPSYTINKEHYHNRNGKKMYGGFFTQKQIKEIIAYAADRQITVIPEIDMPGHFKSAIDNYPYLSCTNKAGLENTFSVPMCLGKETSYTFAKNILSEIADLFPSKYIHIGGDEVNTKPWKTCPFCQKKIKDNHLKNEHELQSYFNQEIERFLKSKGKKLIGWDEIAEGGLSKDATMMWWRNWAPKTREIAANNGNNIIITPDFEYYFDFKNEATPLEKVYKYEPVPKDFTLTQTKHILGVQANLWAEYIPNFKRLQYQAFPRMLALAETGWTAKKDKNFEEFSKRMDIQYKRLDALKIQYYIPSVIGLKNKVGFLDTAEITLKTPLDDMEIYYTTDGSTPSKLSKKYDAPLKFSETTTLKTIAYRGNIASEIKMAFVEKQTYLKSVTVSPKIGSINRWVVLNTFKLVKNVKLPKKATFKAVNTINLAGYKDKNQMSMVFKGYFLAEEDGLYEFATKSDDGSLLYIGNKLVVDNGGNHSAILRDGIVALKKGWHPLTVKYHEAGGGNELTVWYKAPNKEQEILKGNNIGH
ncbi:MAG: family 20 glycosylhydrolase [Polaribacter sp.]